MSFWDIVAEQPKPNQTWHVLCAYFMQTIPRLRKLWTNYELLGYRGGALGRHFVLFPKLSRKQA